MPTMMLSEQFDQQQCIACGVHWLMPTYLLNERRKDKKSFYCPNGHAQAYTESEADILRRERDRLKQRQAMLEDDVRAATARAERAERAQKKLKKQAAAGSCPCCHRSFANMAKHMKMEHPEFVAEQGAKVIPIAPKDRASA